ncbi:MAG: TIM barrel protein [Anaerolineae bacterium]
MEVTAIGVAVGSGLRDGHLGSLKEALAYICDLGYTAAEINAASVSAIINGRLHAAQAERLADVLKSFPLHYSVHAPNRLNLAYGVPTEAQTAVFEACLELCARIGASVLVYHSGLQALDAARAGLCPLPDEEELRRGREREVEGLRELARIAYDMGVTIAMENGDPHLWEIQLLRAHGVAPEELPLYHERLRIPPIIEQIRAVNHPALGLCLDIAHLHIAAHVVGFDYLEAVKQAAPWTVHIHANDNFGALDNGFDAEADRLPFGEADLHLPPGWGAIPFSAVFQELGDYRGRLILEIKPRYAEHLGESLAMIGSLVNSA